MEKKAYQKFITDQKYIKSRLFTPEPPTLGQVWTNLNITILPDYLQYIKSLLTEKQRIQLLDYSLQTHLIEMAMKPHPRSDFQQCTRKIIQYMQGHKQFWMKNNQDDDCKLQIAGQNYEKDLKQIQNNLNPLKQNYPERPYRLIHQQMIPDDYIIMKNQKITPVKFPLNVSLLPYIIEFILCSSRKPEQYGSDIEKYNLQRKKYRLVYREIMQRLLMGVRSKSKTTQQFGYKERGTLLKQEEKLAKREGQQNMYKFISYTQKFEGIETKSLSSAREYILVINLIGLLVNLEQRITESKIQLLYSSKVENDQKVQQIQQQNQQKMQNNQKMEIQQIDKQEKQYQQNVQKIKIENSEFKKTSLQMSQQNNIIEQAKPLQQQEIKIHIQSQNISAQQFIELNQKLCNKIYTKKQSSQMSNTLIQLYGAQLNSALSFLQAKEDQEQKSMIPWKGFYNNLQEINNVKMLFDQMLQHPEIAQQSKYKAHGIQLPWREQQYKNFLIKFLQFYNVPTNNRKIASAMTQMIEQQRKQNTQINRESILPSHVKYIKGIYCRNMNQRIDSGEIGGGKKGYFDSKKQFLKRDIESFNMKWFKKEGTKTKSKGRQKNKKNSKKNRRRRRYQLDNEDQMDSDY